MDNTLVKQPIIWVDDETQLEQLCEKWEQLELLACDTEFMRADTFYPLAGLFQVNDGEANYLIDPVKINDFFPLSELLDNPNVIKIFHSCSEDLDVFYHHVGTMPKALFDTQIAAAFAGYGFSVGFANLVRKLSGDELPKTETRSDWLSRPLSQSQLAYAAMDVEHLYAVAKRMIRELTEKSRLEWVYEESRTQVEKYFDTQNPENSYLRIKSLWKLSAQQQAVAVEIARWRESRAQERNLPRNRVLKDSAVFDIAKIMPEHVGQLRKVETLIERIIKKDGAQIIGVVQAAKEATPVGAQPIIERPIDSRDKPLLADFRACTEALAESLSIPKEMLLKKRDFEELVRAEKRGEREKFLRENLTGWRQRVLFEPLKTLQLTQQGEV